MKTIKVILSSLVALSLVMGSATVGFNKTLAESIGSKVSLSIESQEDVYGLQFEIKYNTDELVLNDISSKVDGYTFEYEELQVYLDADHRRDRRTFSINFEYKFGAFEENKKYRREESGYDRGGEGGGMNQGF